MKNPLKWPIICFRPHKKIKSRIISGALIVKNVQLQDKSDGQISGECTNFRETLGRQAFRCIPSCKILYLIGCQVDDEVSNLLRGAESTHALPRDKVSPSLIRILAFLYAIFY